MHLFTETAKRIGLCVSGITVKGLIKLVERDGLTTKNKVIAFIGTNDILQAARSPSPVSYFLIQYEFIFAQVIKSNINNILVAAHFPQDSEGVPGAPKEDADQKMHPGGISDCAPGPSSFG